MVVQSALWLLWDPWSLVFRSSRSGLLIQWGPLHLECPECPVILSTQLLLLPPWFQSDLLPLWPQSAPWNLALRSPQ